MFHLLQEIGNVRNLAPWIEGSVEGKAYSNYSTRVRTRWNTKSAAEESVGTIFSVINTGSLTIASLFHMYITVYCIHNQLSSGTIPQEDTNQRDMST